MASTLALRLQTCTRGSREKPVIIARFWLLWSQHPLDMDQLQEELAEAIRVFEPRISPRNLTIHTSKERHMVTFEVEGEMWANPLPEHLHIKTSVDLETGQCLLGDAPRRRLDHLHRCASGARELEALRVADGADGCRRIPAGSGRTRGILDPDRAAAHQHPH